MIPARLDAWTCLTAGIPLTLLLDLAAGAQLDSRAVLEGEAVGTLVAQEWAETAIADRGQAIIA
jgi:hypothetical protein